MKKKRQLKKDSKKAQSGEDIVKLAIDETKDIALALLKKGPDYKIVILNKWCEVLNTIARSKNSVKIKQTFDTFARKTQNG